MQALERVWIDRRESCDRAHVPLSLLQMFQKRFHSGSELRFHGICHFLTFNVTTQGVADRHRLEGTGDPDGISYGRRVIPKFVQLAIECQQLGRDWPGISGSLLQDDCVKHRSIRPASEGNTLSPRSEDVPQLQRNPSRPGALCQFLLSTLTSGEMQGDDHCSKGSDGCGPSSGFLRPQFRYPKNCSCSSGSGPEAERCQEPRTPRSLYQRIPSLPHHPHPAYVQERILP